MNTKNVLLGILIVVVFAVGFMIGRFSSVGNTYISGSTSVPTTASDTTSSDESGNTSDVAVTEDKIISASNLTAGQKKLLGALGIDTDSITVTPEMVACAESSLGPARIDEITNGANPSFTEGLKLATCYK